MSSCNCKISFAWQCPNCNEINFVEEITKNIGIKSYGCKKCSKHYTIQIVGVPWENKKIENMV